MAIILAYFFGIERFLFRLRMYRFPSPNKKVSRFVSGIEVTGITPLAKPATNCLTSPLAGLSIASNPFAGAFSRFLQCFSQCRIVKFMRKRPRLRSFASIHIFCPVSECQTLLHSAIPHLDGKRLKT
jgi:hypothetical protein